MSFCKSGEAKVACWGVFFYCTYRHLMNHNESYVIPMYIQKGIRTVYHIANKDGLY